MKDYPIVMGVDDAMYQGFKALKTQLIGVVCQGVRMVDTIRGEIDVDGNDSTDVLIRLVKQKEKHVQYIITDTITFGGFNIMDMKRVFQEVKKPIIAIVDREINLDSVKKALIQKFPDSFKDKLQLIFNAGNLYQTDIKTAGGYSKVYFHAIGIDIDEVELLLNKVCIDSKQPECTRLAHIIGRLF
ncbi:MAG: DUF99 family protein [Promethearchaeota archaeon]